MCPAARVYLERTNASVETVNRASEIRLMAERQMGDFLKQMPKATGTRGTGDANVGRATGASKREAPVNDQPPTLAQIGITHKQSHVAQKLAAIPAPEFTERIAVAKASGGKLSTAKVLQPVQTNQSIQPSPAPLAAK